MHTISLVLDDCTLHGTGPMCTSFLAVLVLKPVPVMVIAVPPAVEPRDGLTPVMVGVAEPENENPDEERKNFDDPSIINPISQKPFDWNEVN